MIRPGKNRAETRRRGDDYPTGLPRPGRPRLRPLSGLPINRIIPNMLTLAALSAGMTAIRFSISGHWEAAVGAVLVAAVFDGLDGRVARLLKSSSSFGAQLDSLSDFLCFGVAPALMLYLWTMSSLGSVGWVVALLFGVCSALRLARFNTQLLVTDPPPYAAHFFTGIPAPAAAGLAMLPLIANFEFGYQFLRWPGFSFVTTIVIALMMVSRVPTFSFKKVRLAQDEVAPVLVGAALLAAFLTTEPWLTLLFVGIAYGSSIPFSIRAYARFVREAKAAEGELTPDDDGLGTAE